MSTNPIDKNSTPKPTGSLEELFRHHLGEEAAVPPRPMLWDQIDNSLLIRQNEVYRKRLAATRWVAAASLFLATLAGTGWWSTHDSHLGEGSLATTSRPAASGAGASTTENAAAGNARGGNSTTDALNQHATSAAQAASVAAVASGNGGTTGTANGRGLTARNLAADGSATGNQAGSAANTQRSAIAAATSGSSAGRHAGFGSMAAHSGFNTTPAAAGYSTKYRNGTRASESAQSGSAATNMHSQANSPEVIAAHSQPANNSAVPGNALNADANSLTPPTAGQTLAATDAAAAQTTAATSTSSLATAATEGTTQGALSEAATPQAMAAVAPEQVDLLAARTAILNMAAPDALPNGLAALALPEPEPAAISHRWHYGASYTAGLFNPNVNFSRKGIESEHDYNPALGPDSPALTEAAATQYRQNLRPGLSQRIALLATRHLSGHWSLSTGAELTRATATSATATSFVGEQLPDLGQNTAGPLHTTDFRYTLASIPVEVRYSNPVKRGWSLYGRLGGVVSALLGVRSEVEDNPEATRTYSILSAGTPYRRAVVSLRGAAGTQFRNNTGKWAFTLGPVAEVGLTSMNAHPVQSYLAQSHAYSFGLEAGVEFGK